MLCHGTNGNHQQFKCWTHFGHKTLSPYFILYTFKTCTGYMPFWKRCILNLWFFNMTFNYLTQFPQNIFLYASTYHVWFPYWLTHAVHLFWTGATNNEVISDHRATNQIHWSYEGFKGLGVKASYNWFHKVRTKPVTYEDCLNNSYKYPYTKSTDTLWQSNHYDVLKIINFSNSKKM